MKPYFIIGTDTDCGKTHVTCALIEALQARQHTVMALKPVASGCEQIGDKLVSDDVTRLQAAQGDNQHLICPWSFSLPVSPHLAAQSVGETLCLEEIVAFCQRKAWDAYDYLLIEGAGGLMVPLNDQDTWIDVLQRTQIPVILVVGMRLGCINHALLTMTVLQSHRIECAGWIANCLDNQMLCLQENIDTLKMKMPFPLLAQVDYNSTKITFLLKRNEKKPF